MAPSYRTPACASLYSWCGHLVHALLPKVGPTIGQALYAVMRFVLDGL